ncbi:MBOAT family O-acyltransferase [Achromobacter xylosoxidans]
MLFNTYEFLFAFLPVTCLVGWFLLARNATRLAVIWLFAASLVFYGSWSAEAIPLLLASALFNYGSGAVIERADRHRKALLALAVCCNLLLLGYFKYSNFLIDNLAPLLGLATGARLNIELPPGISFFTFTQIAYLVDTYQRKTHERRPEAYGLFVTFFPHLIAGPILHHRAMMSQFTRLGRHSINTEVLAVALGFLLIGLFKKVVLADGIAPYVGPVFDAAREGKPLTAAAAWLGSLAYTFQLYFDFSGYSDMAIGLAYLFGVRFPINFNSPYRALNIIEFWRRWHMTLSRFLRDYLYIPLGGNRKGPWRRSVNLMLTMLLGGLWHGAGWTFIIWGGLHGIYLLINHAWQRAGLRLPGLLAWPLTFLAVVCAWVFFRADNLHAATHLLEAMFSFRSKPADIAQAAPADLATRLAILAAIAFLLPNTQQFFGRFYTPVEAKGTPPAAAARWWTWGPTAAYALGIAALGIAAVLLMGRVSEFIYYQF